MIVCVAANPSIDRLFEVDRLQPGAIHRPLQTVQVAGGKGLNAARAAAALGAEVVAVALVGGYSGRWIEAELAREGVTAALVWTAADTRTSMSVADRETGGLTEFYERGAEIADVDWERLKTAVRSAAQAAAWVTISGSLPAGAPADGYRQIDYPAPLAVDTLAPRPDGAALVKVNAAEAGSITGIDCATLDGTVEAARALATDGAACVTRGGDGAVLVADEGVWIGRLDAHGNYPVGSGDSFLGGIVTARERGVDWPDAFALALGAAASNAMRPGAGRLDRDEAERLAERARITPQ